MEARLSAGGKSELLASVAELMRRVTIHAVRQGEQKGLGHAVLQARRHVGNEAFLCQLGETIFSLPDKSAAGSGPSAVAASLPARQLVAAYEQLRTPVIGLEQVPAEKVGRYGIVGGQEIAPGVLRLDTLVEKPPRESAPSRYAICARYVLTPDVFDCLDRTPPGKGGEIQLTDALKLLLERGPIHGVVLQATRHDIGNPTDWLRTNLTFARRDERLWAEVAPLIRELLG
jgi:UTP--glucose-1-phosphate uridylyltransferase